MMATIRDDTWNVLNMQHTIPNSKRWDYSDIPVGGHKYIKGPALMTIQWRNVKSAWMKTNIKYEPVFAEQITFKIIVCNFVANFFPGKDELRDHYFMIPSQTAF